MVHRLVGYRFMVYVWSCGMIDSSLSACKVNHGSYGWIGNRETSEILIFNSYSSHFRWHCSHIRQDGVVWKTWCMYVRIFPTACTTKLWSNFWSHAVHFTLHVTWYYRHRRGVSWLGLVYLFGLGRSLAIAQGHQTLYNYICNHSNN